MNTTSLQTYLGMAKGIIVAAIDYTITATPEGINWSSPLFWAGMVYAVIEGIKGYYAAGIPLKA